MAAVQESADPPVVEQHGATLVGSFQSTEKAPDYERLDSALSDCVPRGRAATGYTADQESIDSAGYQGRVKGHSSSLGGIFSGEGDLRQRMTWTQMAQCQMTGETQSFVTSEGAHQRNSDDADQQYSMRDTSVCIEGDGGGYIDSQQGERQPVVDGSSLHNQPLNSSMPTNYEADGQGGSWGPRWGVEKYLQWLDAIHTACAKLDDLCSKLDRGFPNATKDWEIYGPGIRGARAVFRMFADPYSSRDSHHRIPGQHQERMGTSQPPRQAHVPSDQSGGQQSEMVPEESYSQLPRKRSRRDPSLIPPVGSDSATHKYSLGSSSPMPPYGVSCGQATSGRQGHQGVSSQSIGAAGYQPSGTANASTTGSMMQSQQECRGHAASRSAVGGSVPSGVPVGSSPGDGEYEYLLDYPEQEAPDPNNPNDLKCDVAGVYWDKRSWIASWYEGGKRYYKSFSAKTHGFYRSKYWAIKVRLSKVQGHLLLGRNSKSRGSTAGGLSPPAVGNNSLQTGSGPHNAVRQSSAASNAF